MGHKTFKTMKRAKEFARARVSDGYRQVSIFSSGVERTKNFKATVRYANRY